MPLYVPDTKPQGTHDCRLEFISASQIRLVPFGGDQLMIDGKRYTIPAAGVSLAPHSNLIAYNYLYIYAYMDGFGVMTLAFGQEAPVNDQYGMPSNPNTAWPRTALVGIVCGGATGFQMAEYLIGVVSYWNRKQKIARFNSTGSTASTSAVLIGGTGYWVNFQGDTILAYASGTHHAASGGANGEVGSLYVDGLAYGQASYSVSGGVGWWCPMAMHSNLINFAVGTHRFELFGWSGNPAIAMNIYSELGIIMDA